MAASGYSPISLYYSTTASAVPTNTNLVNGELAINIADGKLYYKDSGGTVQTLATKSSSISPITNNGVVYVNSSGQATSGSALTFDGTVLGVSKSDTTNPSLFTVSNPSTTGTFAAAQMALNSYNGTSVVEGLVLSSISNSWSYGTTLANSAQVYTGLANGLALVSESSTGPIRFLVGTAAPEQMRLTSTGLGIGTSSPQARLNVADASSANNGTIWLGSATYYSTIQQDALSTGALLFNVATANGGATTYQWRKGGTAQMVLDSSGNLGIGTSSPAYKLDVSGYIRGLVNTSSVGNTSSMQLTQNGTGDAAISFLIGSTTEWLLGVDNSASDAFKISNITGGGDFTSTGIVLDTSGNLGLGVTPSAWASPYKAFEMYSGGNAVVSFGSSDTAITSGAYYNGGWKYGATNSQGASALELYNGTFIWYQKAAAAHNVGDAFTMTQAMTLDASGNLGVGVTSMKGRLALINQVSNGNYAQDYTASSSAAGQAVFNSYYTGYSYSGGSADYPRFLDIASVGSPDGTNGGGIIRFLTNPVTSNASAVERVRIDSDGRVLINQTAPTASRSEKLQVSGLADTYAAILTYQTATNSQAQLIFRNPNGEVGTITTNGSATAYNTSSDYRLKNTVQPMTGALEKVSLLKPCTYKWNVDGSAGEGFIAHELAEVCPQAVTGEKDAVDAEGNPLYQGIDVSFLVATLTAAIQEQQALIETLTARITALESK